MKKSTQLRQDNVIQSWHERAHAYNRLIDRWPIFTQMANRLLDFLPENFDGHALDIAGGSGLLSEYMLKRHKDVQITLVEPAENMRNLALHFLGNRVEILNSTSDELEKYSLIADAALCNASFHLMDEETTLPSVASVLRKGSIFAVNCWGHSFKEAQALNQKADWMIFVDQALDELVLPPMNRPSMAKPNIKSAAGLRKIGENCGLRLIESKIVTTEIEAKFN